MKIEIHLKGQSKPKTYENADNAYEKGSFYCIWCDDKVAKYPISDIFRVIEDYKKDE